MNLNNSIKIFNNVRYSTGITMLFNGYPIVFFIRDTLSIGPADNTFTAIFFGLGLILIIPYHLFTRLYKPNYILFRYSLLFLCIVLYHFVLFNNSGFDWFVEFGYIMFTFAFIFLLIHIPNDIKDTLIPILFLLAFLSNITLVYSLITDPNWKLGMRAAVTFDNPNGQEGGNPHTTSRNGLICLLTALLLISKYKNFILKLFLIFSIFFSIAIIILAQVKSTFLAIVLMSLFFLTFNFIKFKNIVSNIFSVKNIILFLVTVLAANIFLSQYSDLYAVINGYWFGFQSKIFDVFYTAFGLKFTETATIDASAMGRVTSITYFKNALGAPELLIIGGGYKSVFMDVPILESMINHGIFGFVFFAGFNYYLLIYTIKELQRPTNILTQFLAYFFIYFIVLLVSNGRPYDVSFWFPYAVMIRFLGVTYLDSESKIN